MSVLVFAENWEGKFKKPSFEATTYAFELAQKVGGTVTAVVLGNMAEDEIKKLGEYGCSKVLNVNDSKLSAFGASAYTAAVAEAAGCPFERKREIKRRAAQDAGRSVRKHQAIGTIATTGRDIRRNESGYERRGKRGVGKKAWPVHPGN